MQLHERNQLRMQVWEYDEQIRSQLQIPEPYRNKDKIQQLQSMIQQLEQRIQKSPS